ncbi:MAG: SRPBCC domain-containing protein [Anaerolineae bacterium]|nr:SRPBCC domain-containing protein [Anaerolineae bacterium]
MDSVKIERSIWIAAPRERVWQAISDPAQITQWFSPGTAIQQNGDRISIRMGETDVEVAIIVVNDPPRQFATRNLPEMTITTTYTLDEENGGTRFTVTETGLETLSPEARQSRLEQDGAAWERVLANLQAYIGGKELPFPEGV